jgi:hypothetical protein
MSDLKFQEGEVISATKLNNLVEYLISLNSPAKPKRNQYMAIFKTPSGGIPARDEDEMGEAECQRCFLAGTTIDVATGEIEWVRNLGGDVAGEIYIQTNWIDGMWVVNWEDCGDA